MIRFGPAIALAALLAPLVAAGAAVGQEAPLPEFDVEPRRGEEPPQPLPEAPQQAPRAAPGAQVQAKTVAPEDPKRYRDCLMLAEADPSAAFETASAWEGDGGGVPARHCLAAALIGLERYEAAVQRLDSVAEDLRLGRDLPRDPFGSADRAELLAGVYAQIGNSWLLAGAPEKAYTAFSQGLAEAEPQMEGLQFELYVDRARAQAAGGDFEAALADLERAARIDAGGPELVLYRASAQRALGRLDAARESLELALDLAGEQPEILLERGNLRMLSDDAEGAKADWQAVVVGWPDTAAADAARANLAQLTGEPAPGS